MITKLPSTGISGTSLQGYVRATYSDLVKAFGEPEGATDEYKVSIEWDMQLAFAGDPIPVTIYDWKQTSTYDPELPSPAEFLESVRHTIHTWHVGGKSPKATEYVHHALEYGVTAHPQESLNAQG